MLKQGFQSSGLTPTGRPLVGLGNLGDFDKGQLDEQPLVGRLPILDVALVHQPQCLVEHPRVASLGLLLIALPLLVADFEQGERLRVFRHQYVAYVARQPLYEQSAVETLVDNAVEQQHDVGHLIIYRKVYQLEVVLGIKHVEVFDYLLIGDVALTERGALVEDGQCIAHTAIGLFGNDCQRLFLDGNAFALSYRLEVVDGVANGHPLEIVNLTAAEDGGKNLVLLGCGEDEDNVCRRLLKGLEKSIEGCRRQHVNLVDDEHLVAAYLRRDAGLLHERLDMLDGVVRGSIQFEDVERTLLVECLTGLAVSAGLALFGRGEAVDSFGKDTCAGGLADTSRTAEEVGMSQFPAFHGVAEGSGKCLLTDHGIKRYGAVFTRRDNIFFHKFLVMCLQSYKKV